jgi:hypothetical protein
MSVEAAGVAGSARAGPPAPADAGLGGRSVLAPARASERPGLGARLGHSASTPSPEVVIATTTKPVAASARLNVCGVKYERWIGRARWRSSAPSLVTTLGLSRARSEARFGTSKHSQPSARRRCCSSANVVRHVLEHVAHHDAVEPRRTQLID